MAEPQPEMTEIIDLAWLRLAEAIQSGKITIGAKMGVDLTTAEYIDLCKWAAVVKVKKPDNVPVPEDFILRSTKAGGKQ